MKPSCLVKPGVSLIAILVACSTSPAFAQDGVTASASQNPPAPLPSPQGPAAPELVQTADASAAGGQAPAGEEIIVTGTRLRGVAPVGSSVTVLDQKQIEASAPTSVSELTNTVPAISTAGSAPQGQNVYSFYAPQIHQLAGSASNSTLVIADGLRLVGAGTQYAQTDPNIIPVSAIERVEVLADGASSIYGSDAVAGVVNYITRKRFDGLEFNAQGGLGDHYGNYNANFIWGTSSDDTDVIIAGSLAYHGRLDNSDRSFLSRGDYTDIGGSNFQSFNCAPASLRTPASGNNIYLSPDATAAVPYVQSNAPCNLSLYGSALPTEKRGNIMVRVSHDFSDRFSVQTTLIYNRTTTSKPGTPGTLSNVTVFGPGSGKGGQINPFFVAPAGEPGATRETAYWVDLMSDNFGVNRSNEDVIWGTVVANYDAGHDWTVTFSDAVGHSRSGLYNDNTFCTACAILAANGTAQLTGDPTKSAIAGQNVIPLNLPLTADNALDIWSPVGSNRTSEAVLRSLYVNDTSNVNFNTSEQAKLEAQGPLFDVPAGKVRLAVGGEFYYTEQKQDLVSPNNTGPTSSGALHRVYNFNRSVWSTYGEIDVPLISPDMGVPLMRRLEIDISGRYDHFNDVGHTANPKFAANWEVADGVKLRANYSRSFVAPPIAAVGDPSQGYLFASGSVGLSGTVYVPVAAYPEVRNLPGCANATVTCQIGSGVNPGLRRQLGGGIDGIKPQKGSAWSVGVDLTPRFLPGFVANVTLFNNKLKGGVTSANPNSIVNSTGLHDNLQICPSGCTDAQIAGFANTANGVTINDVLPATIYFLINQDETNVLNLKIQGIDAAVSYTIPTESLGTFVIGDTLTYFTKFKQNMGGGAWFSILNTSGYNTTFPSIQFTTRAHLGWTSGPVALDIFMNHTGGYRNWSNTSVEPIILDDKGNPSGGGDFVKSATTFDLHAAYSFQSGSLQGDQVYVDVKNVFDQDPPFYNGNTNGILGGSYGFNGFVSNPLGRIVSLGFRARF